MSQPQAVREVWHGLACTRITLPNGDSVRVSDFGAQVLSWQSRGHERMFLSERAVVDGSAAIRGGVPVCFPQFNARGPLPKHGLARRTMWQYSGARVEDGALTACWQWDAAAPLHADFPHGLRAKLAVTLSPDQLHINLLASNTGDSAFAFTGALHTYLAVQGADIAALQGLEGAAFWDAAKGFAPAVQNGALLLGEEVDRVFARCNKPLLLRDAAGTLQIAQDDSWPETVVWNPGPALCTNLPDMQAADWMRMLCVEAALINQPLALQPGQQWQGAQTLTVVG
jgi:glucose-6-phosphate 1-epimerase